MSREEYDLVALAELSRVSGDGPEYICVMGRQADALHAASRGNHYTYKPSMARCSLMEQYELHGTVSRESDDCN